jgi:hypothetical protein
MTNNVARYARAPIGYVMCNHVTLSPIHTNTLIYIHNIGDKQGDKQGDKISAPPALSPWGALS